MLFSLIRISFEILNLYLEKTTILMLYNKKQIKELNFVKLNIIDVTLKNKSFISTRNVFIDLLKLRLGKGEEMKECEALVSCFFSFII